MVSGDDQTAQDDHGNSWRREVNQQVFFFLGLEKSC